MSSPMGPKYIKICQNDSGSLASPLQKLMNFAASSWIIPRTPACPVAIATVPRLHNPGCLGRQFDAAKASPSRSSKRNLVAEVLPSQTMVEGYAAESSGSCLKACRVCGCLLLSPALLFGKGICHFRSLPETRRRGCCRM